MVSGSLIFRRKRQKIIPFHRIKASLPFRGVLHSALHLHRGPRTLRAVSCCCKQGRGTKVGSKESSWEGGVPGGMAGHARGLPAGTHLAPGASGERTGPCMGKQVAWLLLLPQRQAVQPGFSHILSLTLGFLIYKVRELAQMRFLPVLKIYDSGLFSLHICPHRSVVEDDHIQMNQVSEKVSASCCFELLVPPHDFPAVSPTGCPRAEPTVHRSLRLVSTPLFVHCWSGASSDCWEGRAAYRQPLGS